MTKIYRVSCYDFGWRVRFQCTMWVLRRAIRELRNEGYEDDVSILVESDPTPCTLLPTP